MCMQPTDICRLLEPVHPVSLATAQALLPVCEVLQLDKHEPLLAVGQRSSAEYIVLGGLLRAWVYSARGEDVTIGFYMAGRPVSPSFMRSLDGKSLMHLQALCPTTLAAFGISEMEKRMQGYTDFEHFGHRVLQLDAALRAEREVVLLTCTATEKLQWFRRRFPGLENLAPHYHIASFLGMTATSLSRIRGRKAV